MHTPCSTAPPFASAMRRFELALRDLLVGRDMRETRLACFAAWRGSKRHRGRSKRFSVGSVEGSVVGPKSLPASVALATADRLWPQAQSV